MRPPIETSSGLALHAMPPREGTRSGITHSAGPSRPSSPPDVVTNAAGTRAEATELPPTISIQHAAKLLGLSRSAAYRAAARGELPTIAFGRRRLVPTRRLLQMLGLSVEEQR